MKFKSQIFAQVSGSTGGLTFGHNQGGLYTRTRSIPTNPNTPQQQVVRNILGSISQTWSNSLTNEQRESWTNYARNNPVRDKLGEPLVLTGQQMFLRANSIRRRLNLPSINDGPTQQGLAALSAPTVTPDAGLTTLQATFDNTDPWANESGGGLLITISRQKGPAINFFRGPFLAAGLVLGDPMTPPASPVSFTAQVPETYLSGNKVFSKSVAVRADGRISAHTLDVGVAV